MGAVDVRTEAARAANALNLAAVRGLWRLDNEDGDDEDGWTPEDGGGWSKRETVTDAVRALTPTDADERASFLEAVVVELVSDLPGVRSEADARRVERDLMERAFDFAMDPDA